MIPKIIHYCWFGGKPLPESAQKCIASWKTHCPDYELRLWNEDNFDVNIVPFTAQVAKAKKWGFIVDYIRAYVIYNYGGIYLDVDVELLRPFDDDMLENECFGGFEYGFDAIIAPGLVFAGKKGCAISKELMDYYSKYNFINDNGELNLTPSPVIFTDMLLKYGLMKENVYQDLGIFTAYPTQYFCPKSPLTGLTKITDVTVSIHHYDASWVPPERAKQEKKIRAIFSVFGDNFLSRFLLWAYLAAGRFKNRFFIELGPVKTVKHYWKVLIRKLGRNKAK